jgi:hypothetical protein
LVDFHGCYLISTSTVNLDECFFFGKCRFHFPIFATYEYVEK